MPVVVLASIDPVQREVALASVLLDRPDVVAIVHDINTGDGSLRRRTMRGTTLLEQLDVYLDHLCPSCAVREDAVPAIADAISWSECSAVLLALPVSAELAPASEGLGLHTEVGGELAGARICATVAVIDPVELREDLLGDAEVHERGLALAESDDRTVAEALLGQLPVADAVLLGGGDRVGSDLVDSLRAADSIRWPDVHRQWFTAATAGRHDRDRAARRTLSMQTALGAITDECGGVVTKEGVWTLDLRSDVALHPERLLAAADGLVGGPRALWGAFWVPDRPHISCSLFGAGRRLALGADDSLTSMEAPRTRIRVVGVGGGRADVRRTLQECLLTPQEREAGPNSWLDRADELEPFLGPRGR